MALTQSVYGTKQTDERKFVANGILQNLSIDHEIDRLSLERSTSCLKGISYTPIKARILEQDTWLVKYPSVIRWGLNYENKDVDTNDDVIVEIVFPRRHEYIKKLDNDVIILIERIHRTPNGNKGLLFRIEWSTSTTTGALRPHRCDMPSTLQ